MNTDFTFTIKRIGFDENYHPADSTRLTTNFANLARGESRQENLRNTLNMMNNRFNDLAHWDNPNGDRYSVEVEIVSADVDIEGNGEAFPVIEMLKTTIIDHHNNDKRIDGMVGNSFSSYVRDYDFSVLLLEHVKNQILLNFNDYLDKCYISSYTFENRQLEMDITIQFRNEKNAIVMKGVGIAWQQSE